MPGRGVVVVVGAPSCGGSVVWGIRGGGGPPHQRQRQRRDSIRPIRLTVALGLKLHLPLRGPVSAVFYRISKLNLKGKKSTLGRFCKPM